MYAFSHAKKVMVNLSPIGGGRPFHVYDLMGCIQRHSMLNLSLQNNPECNIIYVVSP